MIAGAVSGTHQEGRRARWRWTWPDPPPRVVLVEPEIPPNTGNIARLCAATGAPLDLVGPLGFRLTDRAVRRAGLDYWDAVALNRFPSFDAWRDAVRPPRFFLLSTAGTRSYADAAYRPGDALVFGREGGGLPAGLLAAHPGAVLGIPMRGTAVRSLNLANAVAIVLYEALRQAQAGAAGGGGPPQFGRSTV